MLGSFKVAPNKSKQSDALTRATDWVVKHMRKNLKLPTDSSKIKILISLLLAIGIFLFINGLIGFISGNFMFLWTPASTTLKGSWKYPAGLAYCILGICLIYVAVIEKLKKINDNKYYIIGFLAAIVIIFSGSFGQT